MPSGAILSNILKQSNQCKRIYSVGQLVVRRLIPFFLIPLIL